MKLFVGTCMHLAHYMTFICRQALKTLKSHQIVIIIPSWGSVCPYHGAKYLHSVKHLAQANHRSHLPLCPVHGCLKVEETRVIITIHLSFLKEKRMNRAHHVTFASLQQRCLDRCLSDISFLVLYEPQT